jgi:2-dehydropantoate 2-reductase
MKICIFGAGAIGGYMGAKLARRGPTSASSARGPHLAAMQAKGLTLIEEEERFRAGPRGGRPAELGPQDYVSSR